MVGSEAFERWEEERAGCARGDYHRSELRFLFFMHGDRLLKNLEDRKVIFAGPFIVSRYLVGLSQSMSHKNYLDGKPQPCVLRSCLV